MTRSGGMTGAAPQPGGRGGRQLAHVAAGIFMWVSMLAAQTSTLSAVKAAFLYNFASFADWPADTLAPRQSLALCVVGDSAVADALTETIKGRTVRGHELTVEVLKTDGKIQGCHLLYASGLDMNRTTQLLKTLKGVSVLTVSDGENFAEAGGVAQLVLENDRMRFAINSTAAERARIHLSSKLLNLAKMVADGPDVQR